MLNNSSNTKGRMQYPACFTVQRPADLPSAHEASACLREKQGNAPLSVFSGPYAVFQLIQVPHSVAELPPRIPEKRPRPVGRYGLGFAAPPVRVVLVHAGSAALYKLPRAVPVTQMRLKAFQVRLKLPLFIPFVKRRHSLVHFEVVASFVYNISTYAVQNLNHRQISAAGFDGRSS